MERFTIRARRVLSLAQEEAERLQHNYIGSEHLLLGLMREEGSVASLILNDLGLEQSRVEELVERLPHASTPTTQVQLDLSPGTKKVLELAVDEARRMGHHNIDTEHLLLGLIRQSESVTMDALKRLGVSPEEVRRQTHRVLQETPGRKAVQAWEYLVVFIRDSDITDEEPIAAFADADRYTDQLNDYGQDGWEVVSFQWTDNGGRAILKRPVKS